MERRDVTRSRTYVRTYGRAEYDHDGVATESTLVPFTADIPAREGVYYNKLATEEVEVPAPRTYARTYGRTDGRTNRADE